MRGVKAAWHSWDKCQKQGCEKPSIYRIFKYGEVNRFFCGNHARKYFDRNAGALLAQKMGVTKALPYKIQVLEEAEPKLTPQEKVRLARNRGEVIYLTHNAKVKVDRRYMIIGEEIQEVPNGKS